MTVKLLQIVPPAKPGDAPVQLTIGTFPSEAIATEHARDLAIAFARSHSKTAPAPTYRIVPG